MENSLFEFDHYKEYLSRALPVRGEERGSRMRLADAIGVQKAYISAVLHGKMSLSLEQAYRTSQFLGHRDAERDFFLLLVQKDRAGSEDLRKHFESKIREVREARKNINERIDVRKELGEKDQILYYSSWHYTAVHMCLMVPKLQTVDAMARYLGLTQKMVLEILDFFLSAGLAKQEGQRYVAGPARLHIPANSPFIRKHHSNWRLQSIMSVDRNKKEELHYSLIMSISKEAMEQIREILTRSIEESEKVLRDAKDEGVYALTLDLFELNVF
jgi:uncharacterized protein (TIGR02147 family)